MNPAKLDTLTLIAASLAFPRGENVARTSIGAKLRAIPGVQIAPSEVEASVVRLRTLDWLEASTPHATPEGKAHAFRFLGISRAPTKAWPGTATAGVVHVLLPCRILELPPKPKRLAPDWLLAQRLSTSRDLGLEPYPTWTQAASRLAWMTLAELSLSDVADRLDNSFGTGALQRALYQAASGRAAPPPSPTLWKRIGRAVIGAELGLPGEATPKDLLAAIYRDWLEAEDGAVIEFPEPSHEVSKPDSDFVARVHRAAARCTPWTPDAKDVWIADVWTELSGEEGSPPTFTAFSEALVESAREGAVTLVEAELSPALDLGRKAASRVRLAPFSDRHFIRVQRSS